jgi:hypothetical protein
MAAELKQKNMELDEEKDKIRTRHQSISQSLSQSQRMLADEKRT